MLLQIKMLRSYELEDKFARKNQKLILKNRDIGKSTRISVLQS